MTIIMTQYLPGVFLSFFFLMWTIFKVFIEFATILLPSYVIFLAARDVGSYLHN